MRCRCNACSNPAQAGVADGVDSELVLQRELARKLGMRKGRKIMPQSDGLDDVLIEGERWEGAWQKVTAWGGERCGVGGRGGAA